VHTHKKRSNNFARKLENGRGGVGIRKSIRGNEYDQSTLYAHIKISQ
jgi:hypothetical protein